MVVIPAIWETEIRRSQFEASLDKRLVRPYLEEQTKCGSTHLIS
jgi:hypothetical protein